MLLHNMNPQGPFQRESLSADSALVGFFAGVRAHVSLKVGKIIIILEEEI